MPSTYSTNLRLELIASGEQANTWGNTTNTNLGTLIETAISGYIALNTMSDADYTLIALNGANDQARQMYLNVPPSANLTATRSIVAPSVPKMYVISNNSSGGQAVRIKTSGSTTTCLIPNGQTKTVVCDGTNFSEAVTAADSLLLAVNPTSALQATTKQYVDAADALKLNLTGGTLTGALNLVAGTPTGQNATSLNYVDTNYIYKSAGGVTQTMNPFLRLNYTPVNPADAVHKAYVDAQIATVTGGYLPLTGGTLTGALTLAGAPTSNLQPATKLYVDTIAASAAATFLPFTGGTLTGALTLAGAPATNLQAATKLYVDTNTANKQPLDGDLTAIAALTGGSGFLKKTGFETWALDTNTYITGNQTITLSGAITGSGTTAITTTLADSPVIAGTYTNANVTVNAKGIVTSASNGSSFALPTATDTTLGGVKVNGNTVSISSGTLFLNSTNVGNALGYTACRADGQNATGTWTIDTEGSADYLQYAGSYYTANQFYLATNPAGYVTGTGGGASGTWNINILGSAAQVGGYTASQFVLDSELTTVLAGYPTVTGVGATGTGWGISITGSSTSCTGNAATASSVAWSGVTSKPADYPGGCTGTAATATNALALGGTSAASYSTSAQIASAYLPLTAGSSKPLTGMLFGQNPSFTTSKTITGVWPYGGSYYPFTGSFKVDTGSNYAAFAIGQFNNSTLSGSDPQIPILITTAGQVNFNYLCSFAAGINVYGGTKNFFIQHPIVEGKNLIHAAVEAPRADLIYRGTITLSSGQGSVVIDEESRMTSGTFAALTKNAEVVALHNKTGFTRLKSTEIIDGAFTVIAEDGSCTDTISWVVMAERNDTAIHTAKYCDADGRLVPEQDKPEE